MAAKKKSATQEKKASPGTTRLYRSEKNRVLGGVCGGLGDFFNVDPTVIRLVFFLVAFFGGGGILLYIILWLIIPTESQASEITQDSIRRNADEIKDRAHELAAEVKLNPRRESSRYAFAIILLVLGVLFLLSNYGLFHFFNVWKLWPAALIIIAFAILAKGNK